MTPADEGLIGHDAALHEIDPGLIEDEEFVAGDRMGQRLLQFEPGLFLGVHAGREDHIGVPASTLCVIERRIRPRGDDTGFAPVSRQDRDADARPRIDAHAIAEIDRLAQRLKKAHGEIRGLVREADIPQDDREFVAAAAGRHALGADGLLQTGRNGGQKRVAGGVAVQIVDRLEAIEIDEHQRAQTTVVSQPCQRLVEGLAEQHAVGQAREPVMQRDEADPLFGGPARAEIGQCNDHHLHAAKQDGFQLHLDRD